MTKGEYRVGLTFNPSGSFMVDKIKQAAADLIDLIENIPAPTPAAYGEVQRLKALAQTHVEDGAMWGVKAATKKPWDAENATRVPHPHPATYDDLALARSMDDPNYQSLVEEPKEE